MPYVRLFFLTMFCYFLFHRNITLVIQLFQISLPQFVKTVKAGRYIGTLRLGEYA